MYVLPCVFVIVFGLRVWLWEATALDFGPAVVLNELPRVIASYQRLADEKRRPGVAEVASVL